MERSAEHILHSALRYVGAHYGATWAHHILSLALEQVIYERDNRA